MKKLHRWVYRKCLGCHRRWYTKRQYKRIARLVPPPGMLLSYPRSGNHWVRFIAEWLSGQPTLGCCDNPFDVPICKNRIPGNALSHVNKSATPILVKSHRVEDYAFSGLLLILRDPKECIVRHEQAFTEEGCMKYMRLVTFYVQYVEKKHIVYYEDLLNNPEQTVMAIAEFLDIQNAKERVGKFMEQHEELANASRNAKGRDWKGVASYNDTKFHQKNMTEQDHERFKEFSQSLTPEEREILARYL